MKTFSCSLFSRIRTEYRDSKTNAGKSLFSVEIRDNTEQKYSEFRRILRSVKTARKYYNDSGCVGGVGSVGHILTRVPWVNKISAWAKKKMACVKILGWLAWVAWVYKMLVWVKKLAWVKDNINIYCAAFLFII